MKGVSNKFDELPETSGAKGERKQWMLCVLLEGPARTPQEVERSLSGGSL